MATWDGINSSIIANRFGNVYIKDYMDISGRLFVRQDASFNNRLFVTSDASFMGNLYMDETLDVRLRSIIEGDALLNNRLFVQEDASFQFDIANTRTNTSFTLATTSSVLSFPTSNSIVRANTGGSAGTRSNAYVNQLYSSNYFLSVRIVNIADVNYGDKRIGFYTLKTGTTPYFGFIANNTNAISLYFNDAIISNVTTYVPNDIISLEIRSGSVTYYKNNTIIATYYNPNSVSLYPVVTLEYRGSIDTIDSINIGTVPVIEILPPANPTYAVNGNLITNSNFSVIRDAYLNNNLNIGKNMSCGGNIDIGGDLVVVGNLAVKNYTAQNIINTTTTNYQVVVAQDISLNGTLLISNDASFNGNLQVRGNIIVNGNLKTTRDIIVNGMTVGTGAGGFTNTIVGNLALANNTTGIRNTAVGYGALQYNNSSYNTACGYNALVNNTTGSYNTACGSNALVNNTTGSYNTALGYTAGSANVTGSYNTYLGYNANADGDNYSYSTAVGANSLITGNNQIVLGTSSTTYIIPERIRHINIPNINFAGLNTQNLPANSTTTLLFPTAKHTGTYTNIGYSNGTFTNNNSYTIGVTVSVSLATSWCGIDGLMLSIVTSAYGVIQSSAIYGSSSAGTGQTAVTCTASFPMANAETFYVTARNTKASDITVQHSVDSATTISIRVY